MMHGRARIRPMIVADLETVLGIAESLESAPKWPRAAYLEALDPAASVRRLALVAEEPESGELIGFLILSLTLPDAELETIAVTTAAQRRGVARRLFSHAAVQISLLGATKVTLEVRQSNYSAIALYCALGFGNVGKRPRYYADPVEDALLMRLKL